jgi:hypothetical protein
MTLFLDSAFTKDSDYFGILHLFVGFRIISGLDRMFSRWDMDVSVVMTLKKSRVGLNKFTWKNDIANTVSMASKTSLASPMDGHASTSFSSWHPDSSTDIQELSSEGRYDFVGCGHHTPPSVPIVASLHENRPICTPTPSAERRPVRRWASHIVLKKSCHIFRRTQQFAVRNVLLHWSGDFASA